MRFVRKRLNMNHHMRKSMILTGNESVLTLTGLTKYLGPILLRKLPSPPQETVCKPPRPSQETVCKTLILVRLRRLLGILAMAGSSKDSVAKVLENLRKQEEERGTTAATDRFDRMSTEELANQKLTSGKHKGKLCTEIWEEHQEYIKWLAPRGHLEEEGTFSGLGVFVRRMAEEKLEKKTTPTTKKTAATFYTGRKKPTSRRSKLEEEEAEISDEDWEQMDAVVEKAPVPLGDPQVQAALLESFNNRMSQMEGMVNHIVTAINNQNLQHNPN